MSRIAISNEQRTLSFIEIASMEQLDRLIDRAQLVKRIRYSDDGPPKPAAKRTRGPGHAKTATGSEKESAGPGFASAT